MNLNDFNVLGKLIEKEFDIKFIGLSRITGDPMFHIDVVPEIIKDNFSYKLSQDNILMLINVFHENLYCLYPIVKRHENIENFNKKLEELEKLVQLEIEKLDTIF